MNRGGTFCFLPVFGIDIYPYGNLTVPLYPTIFTYAIFKYRLMDIKLVVTNISIFTLVYSLVLGIPFAIAFGWQEFLMTYFGDKWWIIPLITSTVLATIGPFIYLYLQRKAEDKLLEEQRQYQSTLRHKPCFFVIIL